MKKRVQRPSSTFLKRLESLIDNNTPTSLHGYIAEGKFVIAKVYNGINTLKGQMYRKLLYRRES
jgi:hypothetical protein